MIKQVVIALVLPMTLFAQSGGHSIFSFLDRSIFAGSSSLANTAYLNPTPVGAYALQNPLLLTDTSMHQLEISFGSLGNGVQALQSTFGFSLYGRALLFGLQNLSYGEFNATDNWGNSLGTFSAGDMSLSIGTQLLEAYGWKMGSNIKLVSGTYESYQSWAMATDLIAMRRFRDAPDITIILKNAGLQLTAFSSQRESLPTNLLFAIGDKLKYAPFRWTFVLDELQRFNQLGYVDFNSSSIDPITGNVTQTSQSIMNRSLRHLSGSIEFLPTQRTHFMLGYSFRRQYEMALSTRRTSGGFTLGTGLYFDKFTLHYANELRNIAGRMNTISLGINI